MKLTTLIITIILCFSTVCNAQGTTNRAEELMKQAQSSLEQKEYVKARYLFMQAYGAFAAQDNYKHAVECGMNVSALYHRENYYKEAFDICRAAEAVVLAGEVKQQKKLYDLRFPIAKERLQMYIKLKNPAQANVQLKALEELARQAGSSTLNEDLLYTQASYYYSFGQNTEGDACFNKLIAQYKKEKNYEKVNECYKKLISIARKANNAALVGRTYEQFIVWTDSVKSLTAQDEVNVLKRQHNESRQIIQEKDDSLAGKQYIIIALCILAVILIAALAFLGILLLRFIATVRKQKQSIRIANEHNELKSQFIRNISAQMEPTLNTLTASARQLPGAEPMLAQVDALRGFSNHIQELSSLESSLAEGYEMTTINNISTFCEELVEKHKTVIAPEVSVTINAPKLQVKTNPEQLERILTHLLKNAAEYTKEGKIILDFKKRGAHTHQFIVTDTGVGIPAEQQENLFKPFATIKDLTQGDGLGLPICALIATKMNGSLTLDTGYTKGSRFILELHA
ncbi:HAMP domain-containing sensor histidine kinase [Bacteroides sp.]|uniref:sensor histidine kinase n=1 Tax=Bacteroides sp. TaxID=29523 RepID=UPI002FCBDB22